MIKTFAISNYRSICNLIIPLDQLNVITGENASGKSNLYRAMKILSETAQGGAIRAVASEGGLESIFWAGPRDLYKNKLNVLSTGVRVDKTNLRLGFTSNKYSYAITLTNDFCTDKDCYNKVPYRFHKYQFTDRPEFSCKPSDFPFDPQIAKEAIWFGEALRPSALLVDRTHDQIKVLDSDIEAVDSSLNKSIFNILNEYDQSPEVDYLKSDIASWRFYDHFRLDENSPIRKPQLLTYTPVLDHDGHNLASAIKTIECSPNSELFDQVISDAFPGAYLCADHEIYIIYNGLNRSLTAKELSDGTLRFILWAAALLTPQPPTLMVINEPELSLHEDLIPALANLIIHASKQTQIIVITHSIELSVRLNKENNCNAIHLEKKLGKTEIRDQNIYDLPNWKWPDQKAKY